MTSRAEREALQRALRRAERCHHIAICVGDSKQAQRAAQELSHIRSQLANLWLPTSLRGL